MLAVIVWFMLSGAPAHFSQPVRHVFNNTYNDRWIGVAGAVAWSQCSPDLSSTDFLSLEALKFPSVFNSK